MKLRALVYLMAGVLSLSVAVDVQADEGWIYNRPLTIRDTVNANSVAWKNVWLINYDPLNSVTVDSVETDSYWIYAYTDPAVVIIPLDSVALPVTFDMTSFSGEVALGAITVYSSSIDTTNTINCEITVLTDPPEGPIISTTLPQIDLRLEPNIDGDISLKVYNSGDLPLLISNASTGAPWLTPIIDTGIATTLEPVELIFFVNTFGYQDTSLSDLIVIHSNAINDPSYHVMVNLYVAPDFMAGNYLYGDVNYDGWCNEADVRYLVDYFYGIVSDPCMPASDMNGDTYVNAMDVTYLISFLRGTGPPPVNACASIYNFPQHLPQHQVKLGEMSGHRGEWVTMPVYIKNPEYFNFQVSFLCSEMLIDDVFAEDVMGLGSTPYAVILPGEIIASETIVLTDSPDFEYPFPFDTLMHVYNLHLLIDENAPIGINPLFPSTYNADRGQTMFFQDNDYTLRAPMFDGSFLMVRPRITLDRISGVPDVAFVDGSRNFSMSLDITSDADMPCSLYIYIQDIETEDIVYSDYVVRNVYRGTSTYTFSTDWVESEAGTYRAGAEIVADFDETYDNGAGKIIRLTDNIHHGLPPLEDFGGSGLGLGGNPDNPMLLTDFPPLFSTDDEPDELPKWGVDTLNSYDDVNNNSTFMAGQGCLGPHNDWLIYGPVTNLQLEIPTIRFYEISSSNWNTPPLPPAESYHEYYAVYAGDFDIKTALDIGAIDTHTSANHPIHSSVWQPVDIQLPQSLDLNDTVYFAWRYVGPDNRDGWTFDVWNIDYITWFDGAGIETYEYVLGDINMSIDEWKPRVIGSDGTYLMNYLLGMTTSQPCLFDGFWASADVNGNCEIQNSDVTKIVNYFRSIGSLDYCPDYPPKWMTPADAPEEEPAGWPNCE